MVHVVGLGEEADGHVAQALGGAQEAQRDVVVLGDDLVGLGLLQNLIIRLDFRLPGCGLLGGKYLFAGVFGLVYGTPGTGRRAAGVRSAR